MVKLLCRRFLVQRFTRHAVEGACHGSNLLGAVHAQIRVFREVLTQHPLGIFVRAMLPQRTRIGKEDLKQESLGSLLVLGHFFPQRS